MDYGSALFAERLFKCAVTLSVSIANISVLSQVPKHTSTGLRDF